MRTTTTLLAVMLLLAGAAVGCGSSSEPNQSVRKASPTQSRTDKPTPTPSSETFSIGDTVNLDAGGRRWSAAALAFKDRGITSDPGLVADGRKWALVEVKVCNRGGGKAFPAGPFTWTLAYADGARAEATHVSGGGLPGPLYPEETRLKGGDCVRGNVVFEVPEEGRPVRVLYSPDDLDEPVEWLLK